MSDRRFHLAQVNIARFRRPVADPVNGDFVANLDRVNAAAEASDGFVWRLIGDGGNATGIQAFPDPNLIVNLSVWADLEALTGFTYRNALHFDIMRRRKEWFEKLEFFLALWWVPADHRPSIGEAKHRLDKLRRNGSTPEAFTFARPFDASGLVKDSAPFPRCA